MTYEYALVLIGEVQEHMNNREIDKANEKLELIDDILNGSGAK